MLVAITTNDCKSACSTDLINWTEGTLPSYWGSDYYCVCYGNGVFVAVGSYIVYSYDGINWIDSSMQEIYTSVCHDNGMFYL